MYNDILGSIESENINSCGYAITFIDEHTKHTVVKFMTFKSETRDLFRQYVAEEGVLELLRSDNAKKI